MSHEKKVGWLSTMFDEKKSLYENHTYDLVKLSKGKRELVNNWVFRLKTQHNSSQPRYKVRLTVKGFSQTKSIEIDKIFSFVVKMSSFQVVLGLAANMDLEVLDENTVFLHSDLDEEIYMERPKGFKSSEKNDLVCKSLYMLNQAPMKYKKFDAFYSRKWV